MGDKSLAECYACGDLPCYYEFDGVAFCSIRCMNNYLRGVKK